MLLPDHVMCLGGGGGLLFSNFFSRVFVVFFGNIMFWIDSKAIPSDELMMRGVETGEGEVA